MTSFKENTRILEDNKATADKLDLVSVRQRVRERNTKLKIKSTMQNYLGYSPQR